MSFVSGTVTETIYASTAIGATLATFTTEAQLNTTATMGVIPHLPPDFWLPNQSQIGRGIRVTARGILSSTATPTYTFTLRGGTSGNITTTPLLLGTAALTTTSGAANAFWEIEADIILTAMGAAGANSTIRGIGSVRSNGLAAAINPIYGGGASPGTTATVDTSIAQYLNLNVACSASSASNTITLHQFIVQGLN